MLLAFVCNAVDGAPKNTGILHPDVRQEVFVAGPVGKGSIVGYYAGLIVHEGFCSRSSRFEMYEKSIMTVTRQMHLK